MLGDILKELREDADLTQEQLATILNLNRVSISHYESNISDPSLDTLISIADFFGVSTDYLLCRTKKSDFDITITKNDFKRRFNSFIDEIWNADKK